MSHSEEGVRRGSKMWLIYFSDSGHRGREKIIEETDRNIIQKGGNGKKDGNDGVWILTQDSWSDFGQIEIIGPDGVRDGGNGALRELQDQVI